MIYVGCDGCRYWTGTAGVNEVALCRRNPPQAFRVSIPNTSDPGETVQNLSSWPRTSAIDWCGEHHPR